MTDLFIKPLEFEKTAYLRVSENPTEWTRDVMEQFYVAFPYFINYPVRVEFKQKDEQKGYAIGAIIVENGGGVAVPIVIKNRELYPFDVCLINGQVIPLTDYTINTYIAGKTPFLKTVKRETGDITTLLFSSGGLGYMREAPIETYKTAGADESLLDKVLPLTTKAEREKILTEIENEQVTEGYRMNGTASCVVKIASESHEDVVLEKTAARVNDLLDRDIWYIYKNGEFSYHGTFGNSKVADTAITFDNMTEADVAAFKGQLIKCAKAKTLEAKQQSKPVVILPIKNSDTSIVLLENGDYVRIPNHMYVDAPVKISMEPPGQPPELHKSGMFKYGDGTYSDVLTVDRLLAMRDIQYVYANNGAKFAVYSGIEKTANVDGWTWVPENAFVKLGCEQCTEKKVKNIKHRVIKTATELSIDGATPVNLHDGIWTLIQKGALEDDVKKLGSLRDGEALEFEYEFTEPVSYIEKIAFEYDSIVAKELSDIQRVSRNYVKEASAIPDVPTVDKVLALNFVNKDTIAVFIDSIPLFENAVAALAEMIMKARIGVQLVDEGALRKVMFGLLDIIEILRGVKGLK